MDCRRLIDRLLLDLWLHRICSSVCSYGIFNCLNPILVWIVVDHDGTDRRPFLADCQKITQAKVIGVVSVPCFEVWLNAHYGPVRNYQNQEDAQRHYLELTGLPAKERKSLPTDFPFDSFTRACTSSRLPGVALPETNTQGPCPSTTMPHLLMRLGLIAGHPSR